MLLRLAFLSLLSISLLWTGMSSALAQRRTAIIDPAAENEGLVFDTNEVPISPSFSSGLDFAPNIVFTPDSTRAFVSYTGSDKVVAFDPKTGETLAVIQVGKNPTKISMTPDGSKIAVPCVFLKDNLPQGANFEPARIGSIAVIDTATFAVQTLDLTETFFSIVNNIGFSADGATGFVASAGTDELLRFDVATAAEIGPRLQFDGGTRPASLTMGPDSSFFGVVLVGSAGVTASETPDSIQIVDSATFQVTKSLGFSVDPGVIPYDFRATNNVSFSNDGKYAVIADQGQSLLASLQGLTPPLVSDRLLMINMDDNTLEGIFNIGSGLTGGVAGPTFSLPNGRFIAVLTFLDIAVLNLDAQVLLNVTPGFSNFQPTSTATFTPDGKTMYLGAPFADQLLAFRPATGELFRGVPMGGIVERTINSTPFEVPTAPVTTALSPDGKTIAMVGFNSNTIEVFEPTFIFSTPELLDVRPFGTGVSLMNTSSEDAEVVLTGFQNTGLAFSDDSETEDVVEFVNPKTVTIAPNATTNFTASDLLEPDPLGTEIDGWLDIDSDQDGMAGIFLTFDFDLKRLDGGTVYRSDQTVRTAILPEVRVTDGFVTALEVYNPNRSGTTVNISLFDKDGNSLGDNAVSLVGRSRQLLYVRDPDLDDLTTTGLFLDFLFEDFTDGFLSINGTGGFSVVERYYDGERLAVLPAEDIESPDLTETVRLVAPQVVTGAGSETFLKFIFLGLEEDDVAHMTVTFKDDSGQPIVDPVPLEMMAGTTLRTSLTEFFQLPEDGPELSGWIDIDGDQPGIFGDFEIQAFSGKAMTALPFQRSGESHFVFPHVVNGLGYGTGFSFVNTSDEQAEITADLRRADATLIESRTFVLMPGERRVDLATELFASLTEEFSGGSVTVQSNVGVQAIELFFATNLETLSAVPLQPIP